MSMDEIQVNPSSGKDLAFRGQLIAESSSPGTDVAAAADGERGFHLRVYLREDRGYVPVIDFYSTHEGEQNHTFAEVVDNQLDVENFYFVFEPGELFSKVPSSVATADEIRKTAASLLKTYDALVNSVLLQLKGQPDSPEKKADATATNDSAGRKGLIGFLGLSD